MNQSDILIRKREKYYVLLNEITKTCQGLDKGIAKLDSVSNKILNAYSIDEVTADHGYLMDTSDNARDIHGYLAYTIIPEIQKKIDRLSNQISDALMQERLERKKNA